MCTYCNKCMQVLPHYGLVCAVTAAAYLALSLCWLRAVWYLVLFPLFHSSHILSLIMRAADKNAASRFSREGESFFPSCLFSSLLLRRLSCSLFLRHLLSIPHPLINTTVQKPARENHFLICHYHLISALQLQSFMLHFIFSCEWVVGAGNRRVWALNRSDLSRKTAGEVRKVQFWSCKIQQIQSLHTVCVCASHMSDCVCIVSRGRQLQILVTRSIYAPTVTCLASHSWNNMCFKDHNTHTHTQRTRAYWLMWVTPVNVIIHRYKKNQNILYILYIIYNTIYISELCMDRNISGVTAYSRCKCKNPSHVHCSNIKNAQTANLFGR